MKYTPLPVGATVRHSDYSLQSLRAWMHRAKMNTGEVPETYSNELSTYDPQDIADDEGNPSGDIRLQLDDDGSWTVHTGDSSYDTDHSGYWGASCVSPGATVKECQDIARDLIAQAMDDHATSNS